MESVLRRTRSEDAACCNCGDLISMERIRDLRGGVCCIVSGVGLGFSFEGWSFSSGLSLWRDGAEEESCCFLGVT